MVGYVTAVQAFVNGKLWDRETNNFCDFEKDLLQFNCIVLLFIHANLCFLDVLIKEYWR